MEGYGEERYEGLEKRVGRRGAAFIMEEYDEERY